MNIKLTHLKVAPTLIALILALGCSKESPDSSSAESQSGPSAAYGQAPKPNNQVVLETLRATEDANQRIKSIANAIDAYDQLFKEADRLQDGASADEIAVSSKCIRTLLRLQGYLMRLKAVEEIGPLVTDPLNQRQRDETIVLYYKNTIEVLAIEQDTITKVEEIAAPVLRSNARLSDLVKTMKELFAAHTQLLSTQMAIHGIR